MDTDEKKVADLVLEGGGVKGIALVGAMSVLMEDGYTFNRVAGTSAGAICGALVASGMGASKMRRVMEETDYSRFQDESLLDKIPGGKILSLLFEKGIYEGNYLKEYLGEQLGDTRTFDDLALPEDPDNPLPANERYRLVVMASDVSRGRLVRLPWDYEDHYGLSPGEAPVVDAVRASMSIPFFYEPVTIETRLTATGEPARAFLVDGGMLSNFPVDVFDRKGDKPPRWPTFGIKLSSKADALEKRFPKEIDGTIDLAKAMIGTLCSFHDTIHVDRPDVQARTIFVDTYGIRATDFDLSEEDQGKLYESGRTAAEAFLDTWDFEDYKERYRSGA